VGRRSELAGARPRPVVVVHRPMFPAAAPVVRGSRRPTTSEPSFLRERPTHRRTGRTDRLDRDRLTTQHRRVRTPSSVFLPARDTIFPQPTDAFVNRDRRRRASERASAADELDGRGAGDTAVDAGLPCSDGKERGRGAADPADPHVFDWRPSSPAGRPPTAPRGPPPPAFPPPPPRPCVSTRLPSPPSPAGPAGRYRVKQQHENVARGSRPTDEGLSSWAQRRLLFKHLLLLSSLSSYSS
jgi:hypothetical protein